MNLILNQKTRLLGCPKGLKKPEYKVWCREKAIELLKSRGEREEKFINFLKNSKKKDDMGDAICQCEAWLMVYKGEAIQVPKPVVRQKETTIEIEE